MGKVAGAALTAVAPEAKLASGAAAAAGGKSQAQRHREQIDAIKARRAPEPTPEPAAPTDPPPASPGGGPSLPAVPAAVSTGSGFLLGVALWAGGLAYLQGGSAGLKKFVRMKFLNHA